MVIRKDLKKHENEECLEFQLKCQNENCDMFIKRKEEKNHLENECIQRNVQCIFHEYGCNEYIKYNLMDQHCRDKIFEHFMLQNNEIKNTKNILQKTQQQNDAFKIILNEMKE